MFSDDRIDSAVHALERLGTPDALRSRDMILAAVHLSELEVERGSELQAYAVRECLDTVPKAFGAGRGNFFRDAVKERLESFFGSMPLEEPIIGAEPISHVHSIAFTDPAGAATVIADVWGLLEMSEVSHRQRIARAMSAKVGETVEPEAMERFAQRWSDTMSRANAILHGAPHEPNEVSELILATTEMIGALAGSMSSNLDKVDRLLSVRTPLEDDINELMGLVADPRLAGYFFTNCATADWARPLAELGVFEPESQMSRARLIYLERVAPKVSVLATAVARDLMLSNDVSNFSDGIRICTSVGPGSLDVVKEGLAKGRYARHSFVGHAIAALVTSWIERAPTAVLELLDVLIQPRRAVTGIQPVEWKIDTDDQSRILGACVQQIDPEFFPTLLELLLLKIRKLEKVDGGQTVRLLAWSGKAIDDLGSRGPSTEPGDGLLMATAMLVERVAGDGSVPSSEVRDQLLIDESILELKIWCTYLAATGDDLDHTAASEALAECFRSSPTREAAALLRTAWPQFDETAHDSCLAELGSPAGAMTTGTEPGDVAGVEGNLIQVRWLTLLRDEGFVLPSVWSERLTELDAVYGPLEALPGPIAMATMGDRSPMTSSEIQDLEPDGFIEWLKSNPELGGRRA